MEALTETLTSLHSLLKSSDARRGDISNQHCQDLFPLCFDIPDEQLNLCLSILFDQKEGLLVFLKEVAECDEFAPTIENSLKFLLAFSKNFAHSLSDYGTEMKDCCLSVFLRARLGKVKMTALSLMVGLMEERLYLGSDEDIKKLFDKCLSSVMHDATKLSSGAKSMLYEVLGKIAEVYPSVAASKEDRLVTLFLGILKKEIDGNKKSPDFPLIAGALRGLTHYLNQFSKSVEEGSKYAKDVFIYARKAADPKVPIARYEMQIAGLDLLAKHASQFRPFLVADDQAIYEFLYQFLQHKNREIKHSAQLALESFLYQISFEISENKDNTKTSFNRAFLLFYVKKFRTIIQDRDSSSKQVGMAIRGYGYFAAACKYLFKKEEIEALVNEMVRRSDQLFFVGISDGPNDTRILQLSSFLEGFASIATELGSVNQAFTSCLEKLIITLFEYFPRIVEKQQKPAFTSLTRALLALISSQTMLRKLLQHVIYQGLICTCSHDFISPIQHIGMSSTYFSETETLSEENEKSTISITYTNYLPLWKNLLDPQQTKSVAAITLDYPNADQLYRVVYDELVKCVLLILHKLDLSTKTVEPTANRPKDTKNSTDEKSSDVSLLDEFNNNLQPKNPVDYQFFLNLVLFVKELLSSTQIQLFKSWPLIFSREIIYLANMNPLVSGFLKLLNMCMNLCKELDYFTLTDTENKMDFDRSDEEEAFILFRKFLSELLSKLPQQKEEMLASSLQLILSFPIQLIESEFVNIVPALKIAFQVGLNHIPLANSAIVSLEQWLTKLPHDLVHKHIPEILPCLNDYLSTSADTGKEALSNERALIFSSASSKKAKKMSAKKMLREKFDKESKEITSELSKIRRKILILLGSLGGETNSYLIPRKPDSKLIFWSRAYHLKYNIPFHDLKPVIYFDSFLPRIIELALYSSDRQSKICACELFHALVLYTLGYNVTLAKSERVSIQKLYEHIFPAILRLGCDTEEVAAQLFKPLTLQIIHWFTGNFTFESPDTMTLLNSILECLEDQNNTALREFSAVCIREFLTWSIKQATKTSKNVKDSSNNVKSMLKRLYSMALHPSPFRRLGAALAFNRLYVIFREEEKLVNIFTVEILINYLISLKYTHKDSKSLGIQKEISMVISHLSRIIKTKHALFNQNTKERRIPRDLKQATISSIVQWVIGHVGATEVDFRQQCKTLFYELSPLITDVKNPKDWVESVIKKTSIKYFTDKFEKGSSEYRGISKHPTLTGKLFSLRVVLLWTENLIAALDCYTWALKLQLLTPLQLFDSKTDSGPQLFESLGFFMQTLALGKLDTCVKCFDTTSTSIFTPREEDVYATLKCDVIINMLRFISIMLNNYYSELSCIPNALWSEKLFEICILSILQPSAIGFSPGNLNSTQNLAECTSEAIKAMKKYLPEETIQVFLAKFSVLISHPDYNIIPRLSSQSVDESDYLYITTLAKGYLQLAKLNFFSDSEQMPSNFSDLLIDTVINLISRQKSGLVSLTPQEIALAGSLVELATALGLQKDAHLHKLLQLDNINLDANRNSTGEVICALFGYQINHFLLSAGDCQNNLRTLFKVSSHSPGILKLCLTNLLEFAIREKKDKNFATKVNKSLIPALIDIWPLITNLQSESSEEDKNSFILTLLQSIICLIDSNIFNDHSDSVCFLESYISLLLNVKTSFAFRSQCLELLPFFLGACIGKEVVRSKLKACIDSYVQNNFPLRSNEYPIGSSARDEYITALDRMLLALSNEPNSALMIEVLLPVICRDEDHVHKSQIKYSFVSFIQKATPPIAKSALNICNKVFLSESVYPDSSRKISARCLTIPMLEEVSIEIFKEFYSENISELANIVEGKLCRIADPGYLSQLTSKICAFEFIEKLYIRLPPNELNSPESKLNEIYCRHDVKTGKELTQAVTKAAHGSKSEDHRGEPSTPLRTEYHQAAFRVLAAIITCTQVKMTFYSTFLFKDDLPKGQLLWENIIPTDRKLQFDIELENPMRMVKKLTTIRDQDRHSNSAEFISSLSPPPIKYITSQFFSESSVQNSDISQYDFSISSQSLFSMKKRLHQSHKHRSEGTYILSEEEIELDQINLIPCMDTFMRVIDYMQHNKINPDPPQNSSAINSSSDLPVWMMLMNKKLCDANTHLNIRLFISKMIINRSNIFKPYAKLWLEPLAQLLIAQCAERKGMHYFIVDLIVTMLSWHRVSILDDRYLASRVLEELMENTSFKTRSVFRNNLNIIRTLVECWKPRLNIPYHVIYKQFSEKDAASINIISCGVQLLGIVVANEISPYEKTQDITVSDEKYYQMFIHGLDNRMKEIHASTAEICGIILQLMKKTNRFDVEKLQSWVEERLKNMIAPNVNQPNKFIGCLHKIHLSYPELSDRFVARILFLLPNLTKEEKLFALEIIASRAEHIPDLKFELKTKNFYQSLLYKNERHQFISLKLVYKVVLSLDEDEIINLLGILEQMYIHSSFSCRDLSYDIFISIFTNAKFAANESINLRAKALLLQGLADSTDANRLKVFNFWNQDSRLPPETLPRLTQLLPVLYSQGTEENFLFYSTNFLLELTSRSPDYLMNIFEKPLAECKFYDYQLHDYSLSQRNSGFLPLFANTLSSLSATQVEFQTGQVNETTGSMESGYVRDSFQPVAFTPTQEMDIDNSNYNWLAPSQQIPSFNPGIMTQGESSSQSSLLFQGFKVPKKIGTTFKPKQDNESLPINMNSQAEPIMNLKRRFLKDQTASSIYFAKVNIRKKKMRDDYFKLQKASRDARVVMYRKYRTGDFPDIQIKHSELIRPLQALAQRDSKIARMLFSHIFNSIFADIDKHLASHDVDQTRQEMEGTINKILTETQIYSSPFIGSLMDITLKKDKGVYFSLSPSTVSTSSLISFQQLAGIMVLENQLIQDASGNTSQPPQAKKARGAMQTPTEETSLWIELSRIYKSIHDYDTLRGIFGHHVGTLKLTKSALEAEERKNYVEANKIYRNALNTSEWPNGRPSQEEEDFWEDSILECLENLCKWKELDKMLDENVGSDLTQIWNDSYSIEHYLPKLIKTKLKLITAGMTDQPFDQFIEKSFTNETQKSILQTHYSDQLSLYYLTKNSIDKAKHFMDMSFDSFIRDWSGLPDFQPYSKASKLQNLQKLVEINEYIEFVSDRSNFKDVSPLNKLLKRWSNRLPSLKFDPLSVWDDIVTNRSFYLETLLDKYDVSISGKASVDLQSQMMTEVLNLYLSMGNAAAVHSNFPVALHFISRVNSALKENDENAMLPIKVRCAHIWANICLRKEKSNTIVQPESVTEMTQSLNKLNHIRSISESLIAQDIKLAANHYIIEGRQATRLAEILEEDSEIPNLITRESIDALSSYFGSEITTQTSHDQLSKRLYLKALSAFKSGVKEGTNFYKEKQETDTLVESLMEMVKFCDTRLKMSEENPALNNKIDVKQFPQIIVNYILRSMQFGSKEARQLFPRLLQLIDSYPDTKEDFASKITEVPNWMFIQWLNQMVAILDKPEGYTVLDTLISIAIDYPQALFYPLKVSQSTFKFPLTHEGDKRRNAVNSLLARVDSPILNDFISALEQLTSPELAWKDIIESELKQLMEQSADKRDKHLLKKTWDEIRNRYLQEPSLAQQSDTIDIDSITSSSSSQWGNKQRQFSRDFGKKISSVFGKDGEKLHGMKFNKFLEHCKDINSSMRPGLEKCTGNANLKDFSPWLANFQKNDYSNTLIELPGQYDGLSKPLPEYHANIASFDPKILILASIRKPKRVTIRADNEKEYSFLVKGGEDLRQDQRIEQLFCIMNQVLAQDQDCSQRNMLLRTYQVIPMTGRLGALEWMNNTTPLKDFLKSSMSEKEDKTREQVIASHNSWISKLGDYKAMYKKASRVQVIQEYHNKVKNIPWDILRRSIYNLSSCPEAFVVLRTHFIQSLASINICQYILGIGDRHLSNFMVDLTTGRLVGIDFGHAFGSATQFLPIPELMPFRLTPQFTYLMWPHKESGLLKSCMHHCLRTLRDNPNILLNSMDIFVKEPSLDWQQNARKQAHDVGIPMTGTSDVSWYPKQKVNNAKKKLMGYNPAYIMLDDLKLGHEKDTSFASLKIILMGDSSYNIRARVKEKCSNVQEQIACLIDHATDENILGRTWQGWEPWI